MKTTFLILFVLLSINMRAQTSTSITVTVDNATSDAGAVHFGLYNENTFMKTAPLHSLTSSVKDGKASVVFENVIPGVYAVLCFHDMNGNSQMDFEVNGMPKEAYGASGISMFMGPPQWDDCKFKVEAEAVDLKIKF